MFGIVFWVAFGLAIGWTAAILCGTRGARNVSVYLLMGSLGGLAGGFAGGLLDPAAAGYRTAASDIMFTIFGATVFVLAIAPVKGFIAQRQNR